MESKSFIEFLSNKGFDSYRKIHTPYPVKKEVLENGDITYFYSYKFTYTKNIKQRDFSSVIPGGCDVRFVKDDIEISYGLNEKGKPPTLISPRPFIYKGSYISRVYDDDTMNRILINENYENIYKAMFDKKEALML